MDTKSASKGLTTVTIASSGTESTAADIGNYSVCGFIMPAAFTGTSVTFKVSMDNSTFQTLYDDTNTAVSFTVSASRSYYINPIVLLGWSYVKLVSNAGLGEGGERDITLVCPKALNE